MTTLLVPLNQGLHATVDAESYPVVSCHRWHVRRNTRMQFAATNHVDVDGKRGVLWMHTLIMPDAVGVLHLDGNGLNNTRSNLRPKTEAELTQRSPKRDLTGRRFGRLLVLRQAPRESIGQRLSWVTRCDCGNESILPTNSLISENTASCGCLRGDLLARRSTTHGLSRSRAHRIWRGMVARCSLPSATGWAHYGARGICVCPEWSTFEAFLASMGHPPSAKHTIDRIDNDGPYSPENCRWATTLEQARNKRDNHIITHDGVTLTVVEWADRVGMHRDALFGRLRRGWPVAEALTGPPRSRPSSRLWAETGRGG